MKKYIYKGFLYGLVLSAVMTTPNYAADTVNLPGTATAPDSGVAINETSNSTGQALLLVLILMRSQLVQLQLVHVPLQVKM